LGGLWIGPRSPPRAALYSGCFGYLRPAIAALWRMAKWRETGFQGWNQPRGSEARQFLKKAPTGFLHLGGKSNPSPRHPTTALPRHWQRQLVHRARGRPAPAKHRGSHAVPRSPSFVEDSSCRFPRQFAQAPDSIAFLASKLWFFNQILLRRNFTRRTHKHPSPEAVRE